MNVRAFVIWDGNTFELQQQVSDDLESSEIIALATTALTSGNVNGDVPRKSDIDLSEFVVDRFGPGTPSAYMVPFGYPAIGPFISIIPRTPF